MVFSTIFCMSVYNNGILHCILYARVQQWYSPLFFVYAVQHAMAYIDY